MLRKIGVRQQGPRAPRAQKVSNMFLFTKRVNQNDEEVLGPSICMSSRRSSFCMLTEKAGIEAGVLKCVFDDLLFAPTKSKTGETNVLF